VKERLDKVIKSRRLIRSRSRAQRMIAAGRVRVDGTILTRPGHPIDPDAEIEILTVQRYVGRGGEKLEAALDAFRVEVHDRRCLDIGASTGGFTDCLLQRGAKVVFAIDVGHGQIHPTLRDDDRVVVREGLNARYLQPQDVGGTIDLAAIDVSFISLALVLPPLQEIIDPAGEILALVKPQFELGADRVPRDGVVKDPELRRQAVDAIRGFIAEHTPWTVAGELRSPIPGAHGNIETFLHLRRAG
jgi:23S rRNA (cytidine1920-2'-O)/16S rRNA (cytidine1409-2'-O)-methyltransferase